MEGNRLKIEFFARLFIIVIAAAGNVWSHESINIAHYLICLLAFILNSQIRFNFLKNKLIIASILVDLALIYYIYESFSGTSYLLLFVAMLDSLILIDVEGYAIVTIILGMMLYFTKLKGSEIIILNIAIYIIVFIFAIQIRKLRENVESVEELYDVNRKYSYELEDAKKRLEDYMKKVETLSQLEERNRISREIHDSLGHKLTGVIMQLDAAIKVSEVDTDKGKQLMRTVRDNMDVCMEILRQTVRNMNPKEYTNRVLSIQQMIEDFRKASGVDIAFDIKGIPLKLYPSIEITLYKNAQEAITNSVRHGTASKIQVELVYSGLEVKLIVKDNGKGCKKVVKGMGIGGMEERTALVGGRLIIDADDGFEVRTIIPVNTADKE